MTAYIRSPPYRESQRHGRRYQESAGLTQLALARAADIGRVTLVRLENGKQCPRFKTLRAVAGALGMEPADLLVEPEFLPQ